MCLDPRLGWGWGWRGWAGLGPPVEHFTDRTGAVLLLWIVCVFSACGRLLGGGGLPLGSRLWCLTVNLSLSHWYPGSGVELDCINS